MIGHSKNFIGTDFSSAFISRKLSHQALLQTYLCLAAFISLEDSTQCHWTDSAHLGLEGIFSRSGYDPGCNAGDCLVNLKHMSSYYIALACTNWTAHFSGLRHESISFLDCSTLAASFIKLWRLNLDRDQCRGWSTAERTGLFQAAPVKLVSCLV